MPKQLHFRRRVRRLCSSRQRKGGQSGISQPSMPAASSGTQFCLAVGKGRQLLIPPGNLPSAEAGAGAKAIPPPPAPCTPCLRPSIAAAPARKKATMKFQLSQPCEKGSDTGCPALQRRLPKGGIHPSHLTQENVGDRRAARTRLRRARRPGGCRTRPAERW